MGKTLLRIFKWFLPGLFGILGVFLSIRGPGYDFLGLICYGLVGLLVCYYLISVLARNHLVPAKALRTVLTAILILGILVVGATEVLILTAAQGSGDQSCEYLVVLGAKVHGTNPSMILSSRIEKAYEYLNENPNVICIVSGGRGPDEGISEAQCMYDHLVSRGIDPERIWKEEMATSTHENLTYALALIQEKTGSRPESLGILSSEFHLCRAGIFARECGITDLVCVPARTHWFTLRVNYFLREAAGIWHYILLGD